MEEEDTDADEDEGADDDEGERATAGISPRIAESSVLLPLPHSPITTVKDP